MFRVYPGVFAFGRPDLPIEGRLAAAVLHAGSGATLSHTTAAWWWALHDSPPSRIHVSAPGQVASRRGLAVHHPRSPNRVFHRRLPVTSVPRTLLDVAGLLPASSLRRALAEADYRGLLDVTAIEAELGQGRRGSADLRAALRRHQPELAHTRSALEERFLGLCENARITLPEVNVTVCGLMVDGLWRRERLIVELDGHAAHGSRERIERDRRRELTLRAAGFTILRYTWQQVTGEPELVSRDLRHALEIAAA